MANILLVVDPDIERRDAFVARVRTSVAPVEGLEVAQLVAGDLAVIWAASPRAPVSISSVTSSAERGTCGGHVRDLAVVWGDAIHGTTSRRLGGDDAVREWEPRGETPPPAFDGFHAVLRWDERRGLRLGADVLGLFPIYHAARDGVLLAGTSPELFRRHPSFPLAVDPEGLAGILLLHALPPHGTLLAGVRRLTPGCVLTWSADTGAREVRQYAIPVGESRPSTFDESVHLLDEAFADAMRRHVPDDAQVGFLLSGGRDSRQLAGYVHERSIGIRALTMGSEPDHELRCAVEVARTLGCDHLVHEPTACDFTAGALRQSRWEHLGTGFSSIHMWGAIQPLRELPSRVITGHLRAVREMEPFASPVGTALPEEHQRGIPPATLRRLLRRDVFDGVIEGVLGRLRIAYGETCEIASQRPWRWYLGHASRAHAGAVPWRLSFGSWPVLPILDRQVLAVLSALPAEHLERRRAQDAILRRRFPELVRLPLDRNSHDTLPLLPTPAQRVAHLARRAAASLGTRIPGRRERRYYHRIYDINGPGWRAVRRLAEPHRDRLEGLVHMDVLGSLVPPPSVGIPVEHNVRDTFGTKLLIGMMLWSADHLT